MPVPTIRNLRTVCSREIYFENNFIFEFPTLILHPVRWARSGRTSSAKQANRNTFWHFRIQVFMFRHSCFKSLKQLFLNSRVGVLSRATRVSARCRGSFWHCVPTLRSLETKLENLNNKLFSKFISRDERFQDSVWWVWELYMSYLSSRESVSLAGCQVSRSSELPSTKNLIKPEWQIM